MFKKEVKLGIAPINWSNDDMNELGAEISFEQCIDEMKAAGFAGCEVGHKFPRCPDTLKSHLLPRDLEIASAWFSTEFTNPGQFMETIERFKEHMNFLKAMGSEVIVVSETHDSVHGDMTKPLSSKPAFHEVQWPLLITGLNQLGEIAQAEGMSIVYHHHMGTGVQTQDEYIRLVEQTDPEKVHLLMDSGHFTFAGIDPVWMIDQYGDRIRHVHLKDIRHDVMTDVLAQDHSFLEAVIKGVFTVPGDGSIDFEPIFEALAMRDYEGWMVVEAEQDPKQAEPLAYAQKARRYIKDKTTL